MKEIIRIKSGTMKLQIKKIIHETISFWKNSKNWHISRKTNKGKNQRRQNQQYLKQAVLVGI